jgi:integrase
VTQAKRRPGGKRKTLWIPTHPELMEVLQATPGFDPAKRKSDFVVLNAYGVPFSVKGLSNHMRAWTDEAYIVPGYTLHGLRKTLGKKIAEGSGTTREIMDMLGDDDIRHAELYTREAEQRGLAANAMRKVGSLKIVK